MGLGGVADVWEDSRIGGGAGRARCSMEGHVHTEEGRLCDHAKCRHISGNLIPGEPSHERRRWPTADTARRERRWEGGKKRGLILCYARKL